MCQLTNFGGLSQEPLQAAGIEASAKSPDALYVRAACRRQRLRQRRLANTKRNYELRITNYELF
jgi:hypothetical protein